MGRAFEPADCFQQAINKRTHAPLEKRGQPEWLTPLPIKIVI